MMRNLDLVITMAGSGTRFYNAGFNLPKYQIEANGKTLFEWSLMSLKGFMKHVSNTIFIVQKKDDSANFITHYCNNLGISPFTIIEIDGLTDGQATTAMKAKPFWNKDNSILIFNIDTYIEECEMNFTQIKGDGFIPCFKGTGDHFSFVRVNEDLKALKVKEKERISEFCTVGAYYFKTCKLYEDLYYEYYGDGDNLIAEKYIAPLYNLLIEEGKDVYISEIDKDKVHVLGTPEELEIFLNENSKEFIR